MDRDIYLYPVMLNLASKQCVIIGGGKVAERKLNGIVGSGATIIVVSPKLNKGLIELHENKCFKWIKDEYKEEYISSAFMCFACTDSNKVNERIAVDAKKTGILENIVDNSMISGFVVPATRRNEDIVLSVYSNENPGASRYMADFFNSCIQAWQMAYVKIIRNVRTKCKTIITCSTQRQEFIKKLYSKEYLELAKKDIGKVEEVIENQLKRGDF